MIGSEWARDGLLTIIYEYFGDNIINNTEQKIA